MFLQPQGDAEAVSLFLQSLSYPQPPRPRLSRSATMCLLALLPGASSELASFLRDALVELDSHCQEQPVSRLVLVEKEGACHLCLTAP